VVLLLGEEQQQLKNGAELLVRERMRALRRAQ
jgi:hypothetical protein